VEKKVLGGREKVRVAVAQMAAVFLDKARTVDKACQAILEAGRQGAELITFPEAFVPGYPAVYTGGWESDPKEWSPYMLALQDNALVVGDRETQLLAEACRQARVYAVIGCNELDDRVGSRTLFNSLFFFGRDGELLGRHRKLMPTYTERTYWGWGDASDLFVLDTDIGRIGGLICGENLMVLVKAAMMHRGEEFHIAVWPGAWSGHGHSHIMEPETDPHKGSCLIYPLIRSYAIEAQCFVLSASGLLRDGDIPERWQSLKKSPHMNYSWAVGGSAVVNPYGRFIADPTLGEETILYADCHASQIKLSKALFDVLGHYARWDVAQLLVRTHPWEPVVSEEEAEEWERERAEELTWEEVKQVAEKYNMDPEALESALDDLGV